MAYDLVLSTPAYNATGKFGQSMSAGAGTVANAVSGLTDLTLEAWAKTTASGSIAVIVGGGGNPWIGMGADGKARGSYGNNTARDIISTVTINDGAWHHIALCINSSGGTLWVDGAAAGIGGASDATIAGTMGVRQFGASGFNWSGEVDEIALSSVVKYSGAFTPGPVLNNQANLRAVWHLDGNGTNSAGVVSAATAITMSGPTTGVVGVASSPFTFGADGSFTGTRIITPNDGGAGGSFNPGTVSITSGTTATATYTASSLGTKTIGATNDSGGALANPATITYTAANAGDSTPPTMNGTLSATVITSSGFTLSWAAGSDNVGVVGYEVDDGSGTFVDVGNVLTKVVAGKAAATPYNPRVRDYDAVGLKSSPITVGVTTASVAGTLDTTKVLFSPGNWEIGANFAKTINAGAYFKTLFTGTSCTLSFDMTGLATPYPILSYRVDGHGPWIDATLAASVVITMPSDTTTWTTHHLEVVVRSTSEAVARWTGACLVSLTGITLSSGGMTLTQPSALPLVGWYFGDSITEGTNTVSNSGDSTIRSDATLGWAYLSAKAIGAECGIIGFGSQGLTVGGAGSVPVFGSTYNLLRSGVSRSFATPPDYVVINQGTNDSSNDITSNATTALNNLLTALPSTTKIIVLRPFNGTHDAQWAAAKAASSAPSRINYVSTAGWFNSANAGDGLHPHGYENIWHIAPAAALSIKTALAGAPALTARTVSLTLGDSTGALANLTGLKVAFYDEATPDLHSVPRYKTASGTTNASGVLSFAAQSTLASGGTGCVVVQMADGRNLVTSVAVA